MVLGRPAASGPEAAADDDDDDLVVLRSIVDYKGASRVSKTIASIFKQVKKGLAGLVCTRVYKLPKAPLFCSVLRDPPTAEWTTETAEMNQLYEVMCCRKTTITTTCMYISLMFDECFKLVL